MRWRRRLPWLFLLLLLPAPSAADGLGRGGREPVLRVTYAGQSAGRTLAHAVLTLPVSELGEERALSPRRFLVSGEVQIGAVGRETFLYTVRAEISPSGETLLLEFDRSLPPGDCTLLIRVEDKASHRAFYVEQELNVPRLALA